MFNQRIERFLKNKNLTLSPLDYRKDKKESYAKRRYSSKVYCFHDMQGIQHYMYNNKDYRRKILRVIIDFDKRSHEYPSRKRISNLRNIIEQYTNKNRILSIKSIKTNQKYEIRYEILFTSNNNIKSYQYWINRLASEISLNSTVRLREFSLDISVHPRFKKIIPSPRTDQFQNKNIIPINNHLDRLDNYELATIGTDYQKEKVLPPYELAVELEFEDEFFRENRDYYNNETAVFAENFLSSVMHAKVLKELENRSKIRWHKRGI